jgi:hypothetical protein
MRRRKPKAKAAPPLNERNLHIWVASFGRVTSANVAAKFQVDCKTSAKALFAADAKGLLIREGGGPKDAFYWRLP